MARFLREHLILPFKGSNPSPKLAHLDHDGLNSLHPLAEGDVGVHSDLGLEHQVLLDSQGADEQVVLFKEFHLIHAALVM